jgi:hypothetical protein
MKSNILSLLVFTAIFAYTTTTQAQVGIGTSSPSASAQLEVNSTSKGFLPPRVALTGTADATTIANPATGLLVYNTASVGSGSTAVTPGFYYFDGAKWQRIINQQPDATVEFNTANPNSGSPTFTPNTPASKDYVYVSSVDNSQWTYNGTTYVTYTPPASTAWYAQSSTTDAGSNKTSGMYRTGNVGIGTTGFTPSTKLHIVSSTAGGGFRLVDGTQGANKVLQSDANGNASWATNVAITPAVIGVRGSGSANIGENAYTGAYITLPNGKWSVSVSMLALTTNSGDYWLRSGFSASSTSIVLGADGVTGGPTLISGLVHGGSAGYLQMLTGTVIINNTSGANKTYYYCTGALGLYNGGVSTALFQNLGRDVYGENSIVAYPMN